MSSKVSRIPLRRGGASHFFSLLARPLAGDAEGPRATLFKEGPHALFRRQSTSRRAPKFEQSLKLDPGIGTKFNLADCYEARRPRTATARKALPGGSGDFYRARGLGQGGIGEQVGPGAEPRRSSPQVHTLTIDREGHQSNPHDQAATVRTGGAVGPGGVPQPVDPGSYALEVSAPGQRKPWSMKVGRAAVGRRGPSRCRRLVEAGAAKEEPEAQPAPKAARKKRPALAARPAEATRRAASPPPQRILTVPARHLWRVWAVGRGSSPATALIPLQVSERQGRRASVRPTRTARPRT